MNFNNKLLLLVWIVSLLTDISNGQTETFCPPQELILPCRCSQKGKDIQIWCSHSDLPRILHGIKSVVKTITRPIDELILENNQLLSLPGRFLSALRIVRLMLRHNGVERLANGWLNDLDESLVEIYIVEQNLRSVPVDSLMSLKKLEAVTIQSESLKRAPLFSGLNNLRYIKIESNSIIELAVNGFRDMGALETIHIVGSTRMNRLEAGLFYDLPKLRALNVADNGISWIHLRAMSMLPTLKSIDLSGNKISDAGMVGRAIKDLSALEVLKLERNHITILAEGSFVDLKALKELYLNDNAISQIHHGAFYKTPNLKLIHLENNFLSRVHPESFLQTSGSGVEYLHLQNNEIDRVEEVRSLFEALPMLKFLDLSSNKLEQIPFGALRGHGTLEQLYLDHNLLRRIERDAFMAMPALRELRMKNNSLHDTLPLPFWNLPALKGLDLSANKFRSIEPTLLMGLPALRRLDMGTNMLSTIEPTSFTNTPLLETINISKNELTMIHPQTFRNLNNLFEIDASHNNLQELIPGLPRILERLSVRRNKIVALPQPPNKALDLPNLRMLDIGGNMIQRIPRSSFRSLSQLRYLSLAKNRLQTVDEASLIGLEHLEMLNLQDNRLMAVHERSMESLLELRDLNIQGNRLELFVDNVLNNLGHLENLDLSRNNLIEIAPNAFRGTRSLQSLDISQNNLHELPDSVTSLSELKEFDVSFNRLSNLRSDMLSSLRNLEELRASNNRVPLLPQQTFRDMPFLQYLDLSSNELGVMETGSIRNLPQLQELVLADNRLVELGDRIFDDLPNLQAVHLQQNNLRYISPKSFFRAPSIVYLNISSNQFENLEHVGLRSVRNLEVLDLSNNGIRRITTNPLRGLDWLVELKLDDNRICKVQGEPFSSMPRLRVLTMRNNRMRTITERTFRSLRGNLAILDLDGNTFDCSCEMIWLRAWYDETNTFTQYPGPRCRDGGMLRESRLLRSDCQQTDSSRTNQIPLTNEHGDVFSRQFDINLTNDCDDSTESIDESPLSGTLNRPYPTESEYFYDQYVDYPANDTNPAIALNNTSIPSQINGNIVQNPAINISNTVLNFNKFKQQQQQQQFQQRGSQFTFFGMPLPSLNMGNLWNNNNNARSSNTRSTIGTKGKARVQVFKPEDMEIYKFLNRNDQQEQTSIATTISRNGNAQTTFEDNEQNRSYYRPYFKTPFLKPQMENGGFTPMLPESSGGFRPIHNPAQQQQQNSSTEQLQSQHTSNIQRIQQQQQQKQNTSESEWPEIYHEMVPLVTETQSRNKVIGLVHEQDFSAAATEQSTEGSNVSTFDQQAEPDLSYVEELQQDTTTLSPLQNFLADMSTPTSIIGVSENYDEYLDIPSTTNNIIDTEINTLQIRHPYRYGGGGADARITTEKLVITTLRPHATNTHDPWIDIDDNSPSSLSELVAPGAQLPIESSSTSNIGYRSSPAGRSTITKIFSTPIPIAEEYQRTTSVTKNSNQDNRIGVDDNDDDDPWTIIEKSSSTTTISPARATTKSMFNKKPNMDWYYANYNKSLLADTFDPSLNSLRSSASLCKLITKIQFIAISCSLSVMQKFVYNF